VDLIQILKAVSDETRLRILNLLIENELCVGELEHILRTNQSNTSRHLSTLRNARLITYEKKAQWIYYRIDEETLKEYNFLNELLNKEISKLNKLVEDKKNFSIYKNSGKACTDLKECKVNKCCNLE